MVHWPGGWSVGGCGRRGGRGIAPIGDERDRALAEEGDCGFDSGVCDRGRDRDGDIVGDRGVGVMDRGGGECDGVRGRFLGGSRTVLCVLVVTRLGLRVCGGIIGVIGVGSVECTYGCSWEMVRVYGPVCLDLGCRVVRTGCCCSCCVEWAGEVVEVGCTGVGSVAALKMWRTKCK